MENRDNLLDVLATLFKWKKLILVTCVATAVISAIVSLLLPVYYKATTVFYAASPDLAVPEAIFGNSSQAPDYYGTENDMNRLMSIANSNELATFMIDSFKLYQHYDIDPESPKGPYAIRLKWAKHFEALKTKYDAIELSVEDQDKELAARMANAAREFINQLGQQLIKEGQAKILSTFEDNIRNKELGLQAINDSLQKARETYGVYNHLAQSEVLTEMISKAEAKLYNNQAKMEALKGNSRFRDSVAVLQASIVGYQKELEQLNKRLNTFNQGMTTVETLKSAQTEASEKLAEDKEHYKQLKAAYNSDFPAVLLMEPATVPVIKERPKRMIIVAVSTIAALVFSVLGVVVFETYKNVDWQKIMNKP
ncbi:MAG: hypothetical protein Kow0027_06730 [Saprospiraceae bacterium]